MTYAPCAAPRETADEQKSARSSARRWVAGLAWGAAANAISVSVIAGNPSSVFSTRCPSKTATSGRMLTPMPAETAAWMPERLGLCRPCAKRAPRLRRRESCDCGKDSPVVHHERQRIAVEIARMLATPHPVQPLGPRCNSAAFARIALIERKVKLPALNRAAICSGSACSMCREPRRRVPITS